MAINLNRRPLVGLRWPALAVVTAALLACATSVSPALSLLGAYLRYEGLTTRLTYLGLFLTAAMLNTAVARSWAIRLYVLGSSVAAATAMWQAWSHWPPRPDGNLGQPNLLGAVLAMALPLAVWLLVSNRRQVSMAVLWTVVVSILTGGLLVSTSRSGWLGAAAGLGALWGISHVLRSDAARSGRLALVTGAGVVLAALCLTLILATPLRSLNGDQGTARIHVWGDTARLIWDRPLTGWGEDTLGLVYGGYQTGDWEPGATFDRAHSAPLDLAASQGLLGVAAALWFWGAYWRRLAGSISRLGAGAGMVIALAAALLAYSVWSLVNFDWSPATSMFWLLAGVAWSAVRDRSQSPAQGHQAVWQSARTLTARAGLAVGALVFGLLPVAAALAHYGGYADVATQLDPLRAEYHHAFGDDLIRSGRTADGIVELNRAIGLGDYDYSTFLDLGNAYLKVGRPDRAREAYRSAAKLAPYLKEAGRTLPP